LAQCDGQGNVNVSKFGPRIAGCGGFINITQNTKNVVFCGTFTTSGLKEEIKDGEIHIIQEGKVKKFLHCIDQITFSGKYAREHGQQILYITERAVFKMEEDGIHLIEIAPGIDMQKDIFDQMEFKPIANNVKHMLPELFKNQCMNLKDIKK